MINCEVSFDVQRRVGNVLCLPARRTFHSHTCHSDVNRYGEFWRDLWTDRGTSRVSFCSRDRLQQSTTRRAHSIASAWGKLAHIAGRETDVQCAILYITFLGNVGTSAYHLAYANMVQAWPLFGPQKDCDFRNTILLRARSIVMREIVHSAG